MKLGDEYKQEVAYNEVFHSSLSPSFIGQTFFSTLCYEVSCF